MKSLLRQAALAMVLALTGAVAHSSQQTSNTSEDLYWIKVEAKDKYERTALANLGVVIETISDNYVIVLGSKAELETIRTQFNVITSFKEVESLEFPPEDSLFHDNAEMIQALQKLASENPDIARLTSFGKSLEGRDMMILTLTSASDELSKAGILIMGGHHAREHLSVEMPIKLAEKMIAEYRAGNERVRNYIDNRAIYIMPSVNPDGSEYDIATGNYRMWRKNRRRNSNGSFGVDLNRNYDFQWGTVGISHSPNSDVYCGTAPFSEPETQAIKGFVDSHTNITTILSLHTFSKLILYPWGYTYDSITDNKDLEVHETMARKMAQWNGYTPQQGSDLYLVSGDTGDWAYGVKKLVTFTFELDPGSMFEGGFYPGQRMIEPVFAKNWEPFLYLMEFADNPYRVLAPTHTEYGLSTPLVQ
jgi:carboxypeptidase T